MVETLSIAKGQAVGLVMVTASVYPMKSYR